MVKASQRTLLWRYARARGKGDRSRITNDTLIRGRKYSKNNPKGVETTGRSRRKRVMWVMSDDLARSLILHITRKAAEPNTY
jgi:hypothetical protein